MRDIGSVRSLAFITTLASCCVISSSALAASSDAMGAGGTVFVGAERLFGFIRQSTFRERTDPSGTIKTTTTTNSFSLLKSDPTSTLSLPRVGLDYTVIDGLTVGGAVGFATSGEGVKTEQGSISSEKDVVSGTSFVVGPRVGYIVGLGERLGLWLRGGPTYLSVSQTTVDSTSGAKVTQTSSLWMIALDPGLLVMPTKNFGVSANFLLDFSLTGKNETSSGGTTVSSADKNGYLLLGLTFGAVGRF